MSSDSDPSPVISRRNLLRRAVAGGAALAATRLAPAALAATRLAPAAFGRAPELLLLGSGEHRYECLHDWLQPPETLRFGDTQGVAEDSRGRIYIAHTVHPDSASPDAIAVFDRQGRFLRSWGARFRGGAHGLDLRRESGREVLYHCDTAHHVVVKTDLNGGVLWETGAPPEPGVYKDGAPFIPTNVAFSPNGDFYVADGYGSYWIHQYDRRGNWIRTFGGRGSEPGKVLEPHGLWVDPRGREPLLAVADRANHRIQYFSLDGKHVRFVTNGMRRPCHFNPRGDWLLVPDLSSVVTILDGDNRVAAQLGDGDPSNLRDHPRADFIPGKFIHPHDAQFLHNGNILVAEWVPIGRITLLKKVS